jgi:hypothetical protein
MQAYYLLWLAASRDTFGIPVVMNASATDLAPIVNKTQAYAAIDQLLDQAKTHLQAGGAAFPFQLTPGFAGFDTPPTFLKFNRAMKARADVYNKNFAGALAALAESFVDTTAALNLGVYHTFTTNSGDVTNPMFRSDFYWAHPSIQTDAQKNGAAVDLRYQTKIVIGAPGTLIGVTSNLKFTNPAGPTSPLAWIRNEELILLRAEANLACSNTGGTIACSGSAAQALNDINAIRVKAGGLAAITPGAWGALTPAAQLNELLYEKRYSLLWEGGHRWLDARHYGLLLTLPRDLPAHRIFEVLPYSNSECFQRQLGTSGGCTTVTGL